MTVAMSCGGNPVEHSINSAGCKAVQEDPPDHHGVSFHSWLDEEALYSSDNPAHGIARRYLDLFYGGE
jgi:hypothetical protein